MPTAVAPLTVEAAAITVRRSTMLCSSPVLGCIVPEVAVRNADVPDKNEICERLLVCIVSVCCCVPLICLSIDIAYVLRETVTVAVKIVDVVCPSISVGDVLCTSVSATVEAVGVGVETETCISVCVGDVVRIPVFVIVDAVDVADKTDVCLSVCAADVLRIVSIVEGVGEVADAKVDLILRLTCIVVISE